MAVEKGFIRNYLNVVKEFDNEIFDTPLEDEWYLERYHGNESAYFYKDDSEVIGFICAVPICEDFVGDLKIGMKSSFGIDDLAGNSDLYYISSCVVEESHRSVGIASKLLEALLEDHLDKDFYVVCTEESSEVALEHGFKEISADLFFRKRQEDK